MDMPTTPQNVSEPTEGPVVVAETAIPVRVAGVIEAEVDGDRILLSPDLSYLGLKGTGAPIWDLIDGQRSVRELFELLEARFDAPAADIRTETATFLAALESTGLVEIRSVGGA